MRLLLNLLMGSLFAFTALAELSFAYAETAIIQTRGGNQMSVSVSSYLYEEPSMSMSLKGDKLGVNHVGTAVLEGGWFFKDDIQFVMGRVDYVGSGFQPSVPDWYVETRGMLGKDIEVAHSMFSPYIGFGYRYLFNDLRGNSSDGSIGYRRESNYLYIPLGVTHRFNVDETAVLATTIEFDKFVSGKQITRLSDLSGYVGYVGVADIENRQKSGFGYRAEVMYELSDWAFGPFINVWRIDQSDFVPRFMLCNGTVQWCVLSEPQNRTTEFGMKMRFKF